MSEQIAAIANRYLQKVRQSGPVNVTALCPFHKDSNPSFAMSTETGLYLCYGCGEKGNLKQFLMKVGELPEDVVLRNYKTTLEEASRAVPTAPDPLKEARAPATEALPEALLGLFYACPLALLEAGFEEDTLKAFGVGFDKWHMRITYPLRDEHGRLMGISGRTVQNESGGRYKIYDKEYEFWNLPERHTEKNKMLWNLHSFYFDAYTGRPSPIVVVEGFKACMWVWQSGIRNVVALMGNRMSPYQKWLLQRLGASIYLMLDNNEGGDRGTESVSAALVGSLQVRIVDYDAEQPDGLSSVEVTQAVADAKDVHQVLLEQGE